MVAILPGFLPIDQLSKLVNIGTLLAFTIVCAGVWVLRVRHPDLHRPFKTPLVPLVPILGIITALYLMTNLPRITWMVMIGWLLVGLVIYFSYSIKHSKVQKLPRPRLPQCGQLLQESSGRRGTTSPDCSSER
jgi:basic amino acid/polyamine antiporter, APA family